MDDSVFFKEEAERFRSHADLTANRTLQQTLMTFSSGFADYASELERSCAEHNSEAAETSAVEGRPKGADAIVLEACEALIAAHATDGAEISVVPDIDNNGMDEEWALDEHLEDEAGSYGAREKALMVAAIVAPSMGLLLWTSLSLVR